MSDWTLRLPALPDSTDTVFTSAEDWWNNACLNYFPSGWAIYAIGYKDAADILVAYVDDYGRRQDALVYPVVFLPRARTQGSDSPSPSPARRSGTLSAESSGRPPLVAMRPFIGANLAGRLNRISERNCTSDSRIRPGRSSFHGVSISRG